MRGTTYRVNLAIDLDRNDEIGVIHRLYNDQKRIQYFIF